MAMKVRNWSTSSSAVMVSILGFGPWVPPLGNVLIGRPYFGRRGCINVSDRSD
jgi:hypothetical protein